MTYLADYLNGLTSGTEYDEVLASLRTILGYAENTWTPQFRLGGGNTSMTFTTSPVGRYTKIGRLYVCSGTFTLSAKGSSTGAATIQNLPATCKNDGVPGTAIIGRFTGGSAISGAVIGAIAPNTSVITLYASTNGAAAGLTNSNIGNATAIDFTAIFES